MQRHQDENTSAPVVTMLINWCLNVLLMFQLIQTNKLKHYPSIHGDFSSDFRQPCVVFTGHPSLRFGDVVHFMELWGKSSLNTIIFTGNYSCRYISDVTKTRKAGNVLSA